MSALVVSNSINVTLHGLELNGEHLLSFDTGILRDKKLEQAYRALDVTYPKFFKMDAQSKLGWLCAEYLMKDATSIKAIAKEDLALVLSNQKSSLDTDLTYLNSLPLATDEFLPSPAVFVYTLSNIVAGEICIRHGFKGENNFFIQEQFNAQQLVEYTHALFSEGLCKAALVGWIEVYKEDYRALLISVEQEEEITKPLFNATYFNQLYQTQVL